DHGVRMIDAAFQFPLLHPTHIAVIPGGQSVVEMTDSLQAAQAVIPKALWTDLKEAGLMREDAPT
ncbi:MAG: aldo/keto reductase, partial [Rhodobacteraceae bacterium]|nr:aldo/keto reductase [Paracoccaceae bacterium]